MNTTYLIYSLLTLLLAGFCSALFAAFRETGDAGIARLEDKKPDAKDRLEKWAPRWNLLCTTLRFCLTLFEITAVYFALQAVAPVGALQWTGLLLLMALLYMIFIRVIPFVLAESFADRLSLAFLPLAIGLTRILFPLVWPVCAMERGLLTRALSAADEEDRPTAEEEIMTHATIDECISKVMHSRHSRFPVYRETIDDIRGVIHVKDLLRLTAQDQENRSVADIIKKMSLVPETMPINDLLKLMQKKNAQMAIVVDEYGGTAGIVSMEDIIEELVGEIRDEYDLAEKEIQKRSDGSILVKASLAVDNLNEELDLDIPESDEYDSIGGYVISELGTIPKTGDTLSAAGLEITVQNATPRRIHTLLLKIKRPLP